MVTVLEVDLDRSLRDVRQLVEAANEAVELDLPVDPFPLRPITTTSALRPPLTVFVKPGRRRSWRHEPTELGVCGKYGSLNGVKEIM